MNRVTIEANQRALSAPVLRALTEVYVQQRLDLPTLCELTFRNPPGPLPEATGPASLVTPGTRLRVTVEGFRAPLFVGEVTAVEYLYAADHEEVLHVRGYDLLHRLRKRQSVRIYSDMTAAQLARELVKDVGLTVNATEPGPRWSQLYQHHQNDLELLTETAALAGLHVTVRDQVLHLLTLAGLGEPYPLQLGDTLLEARIEVNSDSVCESVTATSWNPLRGEAITARSTQARTGRRLRGAAFTAGQVGGSGRFELVNEGASDQQHAAALAQAELDYRKATEVILRGVAAGDLALQPGALVQISGVASHLEGRYVLTEVTHTLDHTGAFVSEIGTAPPDRLPRPRTDVATLGVVTQVGELGQVKAQLPTYNGVETNWMGVLMPGAGKNKGFVALPDVGDTVLVLLTHENPGRGIVLGGLYGAQKPPDSGVAVFTLEGGLPRSAVQRYSWITPAGQRIQLNSRGDVIRLENEAGSYIELAGGAITIAGRAIDFRQT